MKKQIIMALGLFSLSNIALANLSSNIDLSSDYIWRGVTKTNHASAVSGGLDYNHNSGAYLGTWASNITAGTEIDVYAGYAGDMGSIGYDVGFIYYGYPIASGANDRKEIYVGGSWDFISATLSVNTESDAGKYLSVDLSHAMAGLNLTLHNGATMGAKDETKNITDTSVSIGKTVGDWDWNMSVSTSNTSDNDSTIIQPAISFSRAFDL